MCVCVCVCVCVLMYDCTDMLPRSNMVTEGAGNLTRNLQNTKILWLPSQETATKPSLVTQTPIGLSSSPFPNSASGV